MRTCSLLCLSALLVVSLPVRASELSGRVVTGAGKPRVVALGGPIRLEPQARCVTLPGKPKAGPKSGDYAGLPMLFPRGRETKVKLNLTTADGAGVKPDSGAQRRKAFRAAVLDLKGKKIVDAAIEYG